MRPNRYGEMKHFLIDLNTEGEHNCNKTQVYTKVNEPLYSKRQLQYFKEISGPHGMKGQRELELLRLLFRPTAVMTEAHKKEMIEKYGIDPYAVPQPKKEEQDKL
jgi:hypothetical protein